MTNKPRPPKPSECAVKCPPQQVCDYCQWPPSQSDALGRFTETRLAWIESRARDGLPSPTRDELAAFADGYAWHRAIAPPPPTTNIVQVLPLPPQPETVTTSTVPMGGQDAFPGTYVTKDLMQHSVQNDTGKLGAIEHQPTADRPEGRLHRYRWTESGMEVSFNGDWVPSSVVMELPKECAVSETAQPPASEAVSLVSAAELDEMLARAEMAAEVTLPIEKFRDLCLQARRTHD